MEVLYATYSVKKTLQQWKSICCSSLSERFHPNHQPELWETRPTKEIYYRLQQLQTPENYNFYFSHVLWASASFNSWIFTPMCCLGSSTNVFYTFTTEGRLNFIATDIGNVTTSLLLSHSNQPKSYNILHFLPVSSLPSVSFPINYLYHYLGEQVCAQESSKALAMHKKLTVIMWHTTLYKRFSCCCMNHIASLSRECFNSYQGKCSS